MIHDFTYLKTSTVQEALSMLSDHKDDSKIICGGQSLLILMRQGLLVTDYLIATTTHRMIETSELIKQTYPVLVAVEKRLASIQVRNWGTIAGNLAHGDSSGDLAPTFIALDAKITLASSKGSRVVSLEKFYTGLFETALEKDELVTELQVPPLRPGTAVAYKKFNLIENDQAIVGVAAAVTVENGGACKEARVVLSNAGVTPIRATSAERVLIGKKLAGGLLIKAGEAASGDAAPVSDIHASEEYRHHLIKVLTERMVKQAWHQAAHL
jgi:carbon-monoxide dehydrogenase medium subunit